MSIRHIQCRVLRIDSLFVVCLAEFNVDGSNLKARRYSPVVSALVKIIALCHESMKGISTAGVFHTGDKLVLSADSEGLFAPEGTCSACVAC